MNPTKFGDRQARTRHLRPIVRGRSPANLDWGSFGDFAKVSARGGIATFSGSWVKFAIQLVTTIALARILGPSEYGVAAVIVVFAGIAELIRDSGLTTLIIQRKVISPRIISSLNAVNLLIGILAAAALYFSGPWLVGLFGDARYASFAAWLSMILILAAAAAVPSALLARNMEFRRLAIIDVSSVILGCVVGLLTALAGWGATSLVLQTVTLAVIQSGMAIAWCPWRPGPLTQWRELRIYLIHVSSISTVKVLNYLAGKIDNVFVGIFVGTRAAGLYNQAYQLMVLPLALVNGPIQKVFVPAISRLIHGQDDRKVRIFFRSTISVMAFLLWPAFAVLSIFSGDVILLLFGEEWLESSAIFSVLVWAGVAQSLGYVNTWLFFASGLAKRNTWWTIVSRPIMIASFILGVQWGALGLAVSLTIVSILEIGPGYFLVRRRVRLSWSDLFAPLVSPSVLTLVAVLSSLLVKRILPVDAHGVYVLVDIAVVGCIVISAAMLFKPVRTQLWSLIVRIKHS